MDEEVEPAPFAAERLEHVLDRAEILDVARQQQATWTISTAIRPRTEPQRIRASYDVHAHRLEPVGLVYLWPPSG
jgi:hypothetical protein